MSIAAFNRARDNQDSVAYLKLPGFWPCWPVCPVKSSNPKHKKDDKDHSPYCGLVFDQTPISERNAQATPTVVMLNMFAGWTKEQFEAAKKFEYESIEAMVADGWEVD